MPSKVGLSRLLVFLVLLFCIGSVDSKASARAEVVDPFMGDWQGSWRLDDGTDSGPLVAQVIAWGKGKYQANFLTEFDQRVAPLALLQGQLENGTVHLSGRGVQLDSGAELEQIQARIQGDAFTGSFKGQEPSGEKLSGSFSLKKTVRLSPTLGAKPPAGAIVLFDGKNFDKWRHARKKATPVKWRLVDGAMEVKPGTGSIITKEKFTDLKLHLEFRTPFMPEARGQGRGNSGVYLQGRHEVQILDSYGLEGRDNECGGIYRVAQPRVNMCAPPMQWQTYDITFRAPRFDEAGNKKSDARLTVIHNGVKIHDDVKVPGPTVAAADQDVTEPGGIYLQDHGNPVQFRNIWLVEQN
jgi:hypothetical protein